MIPYVIFYIIVFLLSFKIKPKKNTIFDFFTILLIILFSGLRYGIGTDYSLYNNLYDLSGTNIIGVGRTGIGFSIIMSFFKNNLNLDFKYFIFVISAVTNLLYYIYIKFHAKNPGRVLLLYVSIGLYGFSFNGFRQCLSIIFFLYGLNNLEQKKALKTVFLFLFSFLIHSSSIIGIFCSVVFIKFKNIKLKNKTILIIAIFGFMFYDKIFMSIISSINSYKIYAETSTKYIGGIGTYINALLYVMLFLCMIKNLKEKMIYNNKYNILYIKMCTIGTIIMIFSVKNWLFTRMAYQFIIFYPFLIDSYYEIKKYRNKKIESMIFYSILFTYFILNTLTYNGLTPYKTIF